MKKKDQSPKILLVTIFYRSRSRTSAFLSLNMIKSLHDISP